MRDGQKMVMIGAACAAVLGAVGFGGYSLVGSGGDGGGGRDGRALGVTDGDDEPMPVETGPPSAKEVRATAETFLEAWQSGDMTEAAALTDDKKAAAKALKSFRKDGGASEVRLTGGTPTGAEVPFEVTAEITYEEESSELAYASALTVVRDRTSGEAVVDWRPSVLHPQLGKGESIVTDAMGEPPVDMMDRNGTELTKREYPELATVLQDVKRRYADKTDGEAGVKTRIRTVDGKDGKTLLKLSEGTPGELRTTLDAKLQKSAMKALEGTSRASAVAIRPSTGEILAVANTPVADFNVALRGSLAPGSTMKVVTASMLLEKGLASSGKPHPCPKYFEYGGWKFQNLDKFDIKGGTFAQSFAASCNTAFISQAPELEDDDLTEQARDVFGIGLEWQVGTGTFDGAVPVQSGAQMGASLIGQGAVRMNPLTMASVAATVKNGTFEQPVIVPRSLDNRKLAKAPRTLSAGTAAELRSLMKTTATSGTAAEAMASVSGDKGGKTGSAEVDGQKKPNAWFIGYRDDLAAAAVVPRSGHGGTNAGPVVADILDAG
jgi:Penicillin binding protein transpeptidase domain/NTF2-like N-terminal transpeptidase domain